MVAFYLKCKIDKKIEMKNELSINLMQPIFLISFIYNVFYLLSIWRNLYLGFDWDLSGLDYTHHTRDVENGTNWHCCYVWLVQ